MSYVRDSLLPHGRVLYEARIHPAIYLPTAVLAVGTICKFLGALAFSRGQDSSLGDGSGSYTCFAGLLLILAFFSGLQAFILIATTEFAITNRRIIAKSGFIRRRTVEMLLSKVESVSVRQNIAGRLLDSGTVTVIGTGGTREGFRAIQAPMAVRTRINQILEDNAALLLSGSPRPEENQAERHTS